MRFLKKESKSLKSLIYLTIKYTMVCFIKKLNRKMKNQELKKHPIEDKGKTHTSKTIMLSKTIPSVLYVDRLLHQR